MDVLFRTPAKLDGTGLVWEVVSSAGGDSYHTVKITPNKLQAAKRGRDSIKKFKYSCSCLAYVYAKGKICKHIAYILLLFFRK